MRDFKNRTAVIVKARIDHPKLLKEWGKGIAVGWMNEVSAEHKSGFHLTVIINPM